MNLRNWNIGMAVLQFAMGSYLTWLYNDKKLLNKPTSLSTIKANKIPGSAPGKFLLNFELASTDEVYVARETISFFFVTGLFHSLYAATYNTIYKKMITNRNNFLRWIEYSISATLMMRIIALQCGIRDRETISLITSSMIGVMLMGQIVEVALASGKPLSPNQKNIAIVATVIGWVLMLNVFITIIRTFVDLKTDVDKLGCPKATIPDFVLGIIISQLVFYSTFGFIQLYHVYQRTNGRQVNYENIEKLYIIDSLLAKITLGAILAYSVVESDKGVYGEFQCT